MDYAIQNKSELLLFLKDYADNIKKFGVNEIGIFGSSWGSIST